MGGGGGGGRGGEGGAGVKGAEGGGCVAGAGCLCGAWGWRGGELCLGLWWVVGGVGSARGGGARRLRPIPGLGGWAGGLFLRFAVGRADVFAVDDLALAEEARLLFDLAERTKRKEFNALSAAWSPWRAVAARGLWAYYAACNKREGVAP